jgi:outer membrane protein assembly factor BamB
MLVSAMRGGIAGACLSALAATAQADVPMFRGNAAHTGLFRGEAPVTFTRVKWAFATKGQVLSSPAVVDGTVYVGSTDAHVYAIEAASGGEKWKFQTKARVVSSPAVANGVVIVVSYDGNVYALDAQSGKPRWQFASEGERRFAAPGIHGGLPKEMQPDPFDFFLSSAAVANGIAYIGSGDGYVYALDAATGALKWKFKTGNVVHASPAVADGTVFVGSWDANFYALDARTGAEKWRFKTGEDPKYFNLTGIQSSAAVADGVVYFGCRDAKFYALDARSGAEKWRFDNKNSWVITSPAVAGGVVYFATSDTGLFHALDAKTGAERFRIDFKRWPMFSSPALAKDMAYVGSHAGKLYAIDVRKGTLAWSFETEAARATAATLVNADGTPNYRAAYAEPFYDALIVGLAKLMTRGAMLSSPAVADGVVYVGSTDGNLYALE